MSPSTYQRMSVIPATICMISSSSAAAIAGPLSPLLCPFSIRHASAASGTSDPTWLTSASR